MLTCMQKDGLTEVDEHEFIDFGLNVLSEAVGRWTASEVNSRV